MSRLRLSRLLPHYRHLMRHGVPGRAVVVRSEPTRLSMAHGVYRLTLEVRFDDGTTATIVRTVTAFEVRNRHRVGDVLPVRYNPADHADVDVDVPGLRREQDAREQAIAERRVAAAHASPADQRPAGATGEPADAAHEPADAAHEPAGAARERAGAGEPPAADGERLTGAWLERLTRLKVGHADGTVSDGDYSAGLAAARAGLRDGTAVLVGGDDAAYVAAIAAAIMGDPVPAGEAADAGRAAGLLEAIVRLKLRHEAGELDDDQFHAAQAELGRAVQDEAERLG